MTMIPCEDCGDEYKPQSLRTCKHCGKRVCTFCRHHYHGLPVIDEPETQQTKELSNAE